MITPYYIDNDCTLYHGQAEEILPQLPEPDLLLTDPQYQLASGKKANTMNATARRGKKLLRGTITSATDWGQMRGDDVPFDPTKLLKYRKVILWGAIHYANRLPNSTSWLVWDKRDGVASDDNADGEVAWTNLGGALRIHRQLWKGICRAGQENIAIQGGKFHPFQKPIELMKWCIDLAKLEKGALIIDPYAGSCTTAVAAKLRGMHSICIEIEEKHLEIAIKERLNKPLPLFDEERANSEQQQIFA